MNSFLKSILFFYLSFIDFSFLNAAEKYTVEGVVKGVNGRVQINLIGSDIDYVDKTNRDGSFKLKKVLRGEYALYVVQKKEIIHEQSIYVNRDKKIKVFIDNNYSLNEFNHGNNQLNRLKRPGEKINNYTKKIEVIKSVDFYVNNNNQLVITYFLNPKSYSDKYKIDIKISDNDGISWFAPKSVSGDLGIIFGAGKKKVVWDVFKDREELDGEIVVDVVAVLENPIKQYHTDIIPKKSTTPCQASCTAPDRRFS